jgi:plasmid stabilization system protein ParE
MPKQIIWAPLAESDFAAILEYLEKNWDSKVALTFIELTENVIDQISINPKQYPVIFKKRRIRKCVLTKHNSLFYRDSRSQIEILRIYDTRQDPDSLTFLTGPTT